MCLVGWFGLCFGFGFFLGLVSLCSPREPGIHCTVQCDLDNYLNGATFVLGLDQFVNIIVDFVESVFLLENDFLFLRHSPCSLPATPTLQTVTSYILFYFSNDYSGGKSSRSSWPVTFLTLTNDPSSLLSLGMGLGYVTTCSWVLCSQKREITVPLQLPLFIQREATRQTEQLPHLSSSLPQWCQVMAFFGFGKKGGEITLFSHMRIFLSMVCHWVSTNHDHFCLLIQCKGLLLQKAHVIFFS